jgi:hypothetical protein
MAEPATPDPMRVGPSKAPLYWLALAELEKLHK